MLSPIVLSVEHFVKFYFDDFVVVAYTVGYVDISVPINSMNNNLININVVKAVPLLLKYPK